MNYSGTKGSLVRANKIFFEGDVITEHPSGLTRTGDGITIYRLLPYDGAPRSIVGPAGGKGADGSGTPAATVTSETTYGIAPAVGVSNSLARQDHTHGSPAAPTTAFVPDSTNKRYVSDSQLVVVDNTSGINTGDQYNSATASDALQVLRRNPTNTAYEFAAPAGSNRTQQDFTATANQTAYTLTNTPLPGSLVMINGLGQSGSEFTTGVSVLTFTSGTGITAGDTISILYNY